MKERMTLVLGIIAFAAVLGIMWPRVIFDCLACLALVLYLGIGALGVLIAINGFNNVDTAENE